MKITKGPQENEWDMGRSEEKNSFACGLRICLGMIIKLVAMLTMKNIHPSIHPSIRPNSSTDTQRTFGTNSVLAESFLQG